MPYEVSEKTGELVPYHSQSPDVFERFERLDEEQIVASLQGAAIEEYVYSFKIGGKETVGLSWVGAREAARHQGRIHISEPTVTEDSDSYTVRCSAHDVERDFLVWAVARQEKFAYGKPDPFALNKAFSKAQRNAILSVIPTTIIVKTIAAYRDRGQVRHVSPAPPPRQINAQAAESVPAESVRVIEQPAQAADLNPSTRDAVTPTQLRAIYKLAWDELKLGGPAVDEKCKTLYGSIPQEITRRQASDFIAALQTKSV